jgi:hypothetical protein
LGNAGAPGIGRAAASSAAPATVARTDDTSPKLVRFKAYLFNRDTGAFSPDVLARAGNNKPVELGNVLGGAFASDSTFVSIEIRAPAADIIAAGTRIRFRAIDTDELPFAAVKRTPQPKLLVDKIVQTRRVKAGASTFIGFWLPDTGCAPVKLSAEWVNIRNAAKLTDTLAFVCHE